MKKLLIVLFLLFLIPFNSSEAKRGDAAIIAVLSASSGGGDCPTGTYEAAFGAVGAGNDYFCYEDGSANEQGTTGGTPTVDGSGITYSSTGDNINVTITGDISAGIGDEGTLYFTLTTPTTLTGDSYMFTLYYDGSNQIFVWLESADSKPWAGHTGSGTAQQVKGPAALSMGGTTYRIGYSWQTGADAGGVHSIISQAGATAISTPWSGEFEQTEDLDAFASDPTTFYVGDGRSDGVSITGSMTITDVRLVTGYQGADPL